MRYPEFHIPGAAPPSQGGHPLRPCIAVTLDDRLDYFGSTVVISAVRDDPDMEALLARAGNGLCDESLDATFKGRDDERFTLWRVAAPTTDG